MRELESSAETLRNLYNSFLQKFKEVNTGQTESMPIQNARIITRAAPPLFKSTKKPLAILAGSTVARPPVGLSASSWGANGWPMYFAPRRRWSSSATRNASFCQRSKQNRRCSKSSCLMSLTRASPRPLRNLKALIDATQGGPGAKVIGIVSSVPDEGKTIVAANLASLVIASSCARTLVIDSDLHLRKLTAALAPDANEGFIDALEDPSRLSRVCQSSGERSGLDVLPCASPVRIPNAAELLGSPEMEQLLATARTILRLRHH